jgi:NAD(P)-dependent dehydrogenase (short-subunit alcohol dehydrogenase family)
MKILVTGANRGLGLEFVSQYLNRGEEIIATCRNPEGSTNLQRLIPDFGSNLRIFKMDVRNQKSINDAYEVIKENYDSLDVLINNAGIISGGKSRYHALGELYTENISKVFQINSIAPVLVLEKFFSLLKKGNNPKVVNISSRMGSITLKSGTSTYSYDASKAALNMFTKALAPRLRREKISILVLHPGWVKTDMGTDRATLYPKESIEGMIKVINGIKLSNSGKFIDWEGKEVPW